MYFDIFGQCFKSHVNEELLYREASETAIFVQWFQLIVFNCFDVGHRKHSIHLRLPRPLCPS